MKKNAIRVLVVAMLLVGASVGQNSKWSPLPPPPPPATLSV